MKCTCDWSQRNPTLLWSDLHLNTKWDRRSPKPRLRWLFSQICLRTVASSKQQLHIFSQFSLIVLIMPRPTLIGIRHEVFALVREGMQQSAITGRVGLICATINCIFRRHAATGTCSSRPYFVEDGPIGSLRKCSGLDGANEEFVWNEGWPENHQ